MTSVLTQTVARLLLLPTFMIGLALLIKGYSEAGDGFSAGAIVALAVMLQYLAFGYTRVARQLPLFVAPLMASVGLLLALLVAFGPVLVRDAPILTHVPRPGMNVVHLGTLELHTAILFDVSVFLLVFGFALSVIGLLALKEETGS